MRDSDCVHFLQWALPRLGLRWSGYRKVRRQVCKRIGRRLRRLALRDLCEYRALLESQPEEWRALEDLCRITISRFCRDRQVFQTLVTQVLPDLARRIEAQAGGTIEIWSAGCGAGEEPYSLALLATESGDPRLARAPLRILATDADAHQLERAESAVYPRSSLRELCPRLVELAFERVETDAYRLRRRYRDRVELRHQDLRRQMPGGPFHLILCRNLAFTYFDAELQRQVAAALLTRLAAGGHLVIGSHERLPPTEASCVPPEGAGIFGPKAEPANC